MNLRTMIYSLREMLAVNDNGQMRIDYVGNKYSLHLKDIQSDVDVFNRLLQKAAELNDTALLEQAVSLYTGDYLEEEGWLWAEPKKVMLLRKYLSALKRIKESKNKT